MSKAHEAWDRFKAAWEQASPLGRRSTRSADEKQQVANLLREAIAAAEKKPVDIANAKIVDVMTVEKRWLNGTNLPSRAQMTRLEQLLAPHSIAEQPAVLVATLNDPRIQHVLTLVVEERAAGREIKPSLLEKLIRMGLAMYCSSYSLPGRAIPLEWLRTTLVDERRYLEYLASLEQSK